MFNKRTALGAIVVLIVLSCGVVWAGESQPAEAAPPTFFQQMAVAMATGSPGAIFEAIVDFDYGELLTGETATAPETEGDLSSTTSTSASSSDGSTLARGGDDPSGPWP